MVEDSLRKWFTRRGHKIIETHSSNWYNVGPFIYQAFPYHKLIAPSTEEISEFFKRNKAIGIRYSTDINQSEGHISYHVVINNGSCNIADLRKKARHDVTKGMKYAAYETISFQRLAQEGWNLRRDTIIRQRRQNAETKSQWTNLCASAVDLPGFEAWGALHKGELVATLLACTIEDTVSIFYQQSLTEHLKYGVNNALTFIFTCNVLCRPGIHQIFYGLHSLDAPSSVDEYKFRMGYLAKPVKQCVVFNPLIVPLINSFSYSCLKILKRIVPTSSFLSKAGGMIRFYLQGKLPISEQTWPGILQKDKADILRTMR